jgi:signal transduction histidine kinase
VPAQTDAEDARQFLARVLVAQERERGRLAREIHGDTVQAVATAAMQLGLLRDVIGADADAPALSRLQEVEAAIQDAAARLRRITAELPDSTLGAGGLAERLRLRLELLRATTDVDYELDDRLASEPDPEITRLADRVAGEALANVVRHARATRVRVFVGEDAGGVALRVADDGVGLPPEDERRFVPGQMGLVVMRERVASAGGRVRVEGLPGEGVTVDAWLPAAR